MPADGRPVEWRGYKNVFDDLFLITREKEGVLTLSRGCVLTIGHHMAMASGQTDFYQLLVIPGQHNDPFQQQHDQWPHHHRHFLACVHRQDQNPKHEDSCW
ncbi:hypothetical protein LAZ67_1001257 [Cordylochernes scorpioides]|uniref:Uncharacterized protein n=1 Tax=Cordylochernes scorpioides TaxID=51811 RepID=A0ABY6JWN1_9ARAC|nr:hypothetical protein LAZ67_1001257 [Cordylochernes scorpioides]